MHLTENDIRTCYRLLLGRDADPAGVDHYLSLADTGMTRDQFVDGMLSSKEFRERNASLEPLSAPLLSLDTDRLIDAIMPDIIARLCQEKPWRNSVYAPSPKVVGASRDDAFMQYSTCSASDFLHPRFTEILDGLGLRNELHRKLWEWVFVVHHLTERGAIVPGNRGLTFGVGKERLPALFASQGVYITATDAPVEIGESAGWQQTDQYAQGRDALPEGPMDRKEFERFVEWRECDMNAIDPDLKDYDFCWSSCCFEHLGTLRRGLDFVIKSVENTLKPGGIAVHTTEFNLSSDDDTIRDGHTVVYRRKDLERLIGELRERGHEVDSFRVAPDALTVDGYVDLPPYHGPHLKLGLEGYVCTSVGLVIRRGPR